MRTFLRMSGWAAVTLAAAVLVFSLMPDGSRVAQHEIAIGGRVWSVINGEYRRERRQQRRSEGRGFARLVGRAC